MRKFPAVLFCVFLSFIASCVQKAPTISYVEKTKNYNCSQIEAEFEYLKVLYKNLKIAQEQRTNIGDALSVVLSIGTAKTQAKQLDTQIQATEQHIQYMKGLWHEKCAT